MANLPVPVPRTFTVSETETASYLNTVRDGLDFLLAKPFMAVTQTTTQTLTTAVWGAIGYDVSIVDTYGMHSNVTNNTRATAIVAGWYYPVGCVVIANNTTGVRGARIAKNGTVIQGSAMLSNAAGGTSVSAVQCVSFPVFLNVGDYLELQGYQNSGGNLNTAAGTDLDSSFSVRWYHN